MNGTSYFIDSLKDLVASTSEYQETTTYNSWTTDIFSNNNYIAHQIVSYTETPVRLSSSNFLNVYYYLDLTLPTYSALTNVYGIPTLCNAEIITTQSWGWLVSMANNASSSSNPLKNFRYICFSSSSVTISVYWEMIKFNEVSWEMI